MSLISRLFPVPTWLARHAEPGTGAERIRLRIQQERQEWASDDEALGLIPIYRALQILTTAGAQLPITAQRGGTTVTTNIPPLVRNPDPDMDRSNWIEQAILSLALDGNLFIRKIWGSDGTVIAARILPPAEVTIIKDPKTGTISYGHRGEKLNRSEIEHQSFMRMPGRLRGMGPIQAARNEITGARDVRDYASHWFSGSGQPSGVLTVQKAQTKDDAAAARARWNEAAADEDNPTGIRVLGSGTTYTPITLNPEDAQWLDVRRFTVSDFSRLFGIPSSLMLAAIEGNSMTYSNVEQEWLAFVRFTLTGYLRKIEEALTTISPMGQTVRFNIDGLLRSDTKSRYDAHAVALANGFMTVDEIRAIEDMPPLTDQQRGQILMHLSATTTTESAADAH